jgi:predicted Zn-dependent protease
MKKLFLFSFLLLFTSCIDINIGGFELKGKDIESAVNIGKAALSAAETFSPSQEHYIGRSVTANLLSQYKPYNNEAVNLYLNTMGKYLASYSIRPDTFDGYHFQAIESDSLNAFAAPGGFVLVTTALIKSCKNEDQLAAVLAHEIAHIENYHAIKSIEASRLTNFGSVIAKEVVKREGKQDMQKILGSFGGMIDDVSQNLINTGYSRKTEYEADLSATNILKRSGYNPQAMKEVLITLEPHHAEGGMGFAKTHPHPKDRRQNIKGALKNTATSTSALRKARFRRVMAKSGL